MIIYNFLYGKSSLLYFFSLISNGLLFIGAIIGFWGIAADINTTSKTGFSLFFGGCLLFIIEVVQILAPSMWRLWGGIKWLGFPTPSSACAQRLLSRRIADQCQSL